MERREFIHGSGAVAGLGLVTALWPLVAKADNVTGWNKAAFEAKNLPDVLKALGAVNGGESKELTLQAPEIAENGAVVRLSADSHLPGTTQIGFLVDKNPAALSALFDIPKNTAPHVGLNVKLGQTSNVYALAKIGDKFYYAVKEVKVTIGGCGG